LDVILRDLLGFLQLGEDSEFRTNQTAEAALDAVLGIENEFGRMVSFCVEPFALFEAFVGAEFDTEAASFATVVYNMNLSLRNGMGLGIQR
jgi:hypothetical protein